MDILNTYLIVDESSGAMGAIRFLTFPLTFGMIFALINMVFFLAEPKHKSSMCWSIVCLLVAIVSAIGVYHYWRETPLLRRHEILWRDDSQAFQINPQKYKYIEQRGDIFVIEEVEPACTRGENND